MRLVVAIGGNALLKRGEPLSAANQARNMAVSAMGLAQVCAGHEVALVHGNGPQVGLLALEAAAYPDVAPYPLDVLGAESQGMIGYVITQALRNVLPGREIAAMVTQTRVDHDDPAFAHPTKPIGPVYTTAEFAGITPPSNWRFAPDGPAMRRVVASPGPLEIIELAAIERLVTAGVLTICCGGGGVPVIDATPMGSIPQITGIEAVIDKDATAALLAIEIEADHLIILTDVDGIYVNWGHPEQRLLRRSTIAELEKLDFAEGSMAPKVAAVCRFVAETGRSAFIGSLEDASAVVAGVAGTRVG